MRKIDKMLLGLCVDATIGGASLALGALAAFDGAWHRVALSAVTALLGFGGAGLTYAYLKPRIWFMDMKK